MLASRFYAPKSKCYNVQVHDIGYDVIARRAQIVSYDRVKKSLEILCR